MTVKHVLEAKQKGGQTTGFVLWILLVCLLFSQLPLAVHAAAHAEPAAEAAEKGMWPDLADINASAWLVADTATGEIVISHNPDEVLFPASVTKIMTATLLIESQLLDQTVIVSEAAVDLEYDMAKVGFLAGEAVQLRDVMYGLMLASGNDAARIVAESLAGSEAGFAEMMNAKAASLGMLNTHFKNPSGLHDPEHVTTAADILILIQYALKNSVFRDLVSTRIYAMPATDLHPYNAWAMLQNTNRFLTFGENILSSPYFQTYSGIKTGTTRAAGYCLTALAQTWDGRELVLILFGVPTTGPYAQLYQNAYTLFNEAAVRLDLPHQPSEPEPTPTAAITETQVPDPTVITSPETSKDPADEITDQNGDPAETINNGSLMADDIWRTAFFILLAVDIVAGLILIAQRRKS